MIKLTPVAAEQIIAGLKKEEGGGQVYLRIAGKRTEQGSIDHTFGIDDRKEHDIHVVSEQVDIVIFPDHKELLSGLVVDFAELEGGAKGFVFLNPNDPDYVAPKTDEAPNLI
jgi:iron-sulfur cluster assembly protein